MMAFLGKLWRAFVAFADTHSIMIFQREQITRHSGNPYLDRLIVLKAKCLSVFIHRFLDSDDECIHDHPWNFVSVILRSGYWEIDAAVQATWYGPGSVLCRRANWSHRIVIEPDRPPVSLVIAGPVLRM